MLLSSSTKLVSCSSIKLRVIGNPSEQFWMTICHFPLFSDRLKDSRRFYLGRHAIAVAESLACQNFFQLVMMFCLTGNKGPTKSSVIFEDLMWKVKQGSLFSFWFLLVIVFNFKRQNQVKPSYIYVVHRKITSRFLSDCCVFLNNPPLILWEEVIKYSLNLCWSQAHRATEIIGSK